MEREPKLLPSSTQLGQAWGNDSGEGIKEAGISNSRESLSLNYFSWKVF